MSDDLLNIAIRKRTGIEFSGQAKSLSSVNDRGPFDILGKHTNFVCLLRDKIDINTVDNQWIKIPISRAVLRVEKNNLEVYLGI